jgi:hypothetical protein
VFVVLEKKMKSNHLKFALWLVVVIVLAPSVWAQKLAAKPLVFESVLDKYQPYKEQDVQSWVKANNKVQERGGWRQYLKESERARSQP